MEKLILLLLGLGVFALLVNYVVKDVERQNYWGVFCAVDVATIVTYLKFNPELRVLNIPTGNSDGLMCHPIYKVVRVR